MAVYRPRAMVKLFVPNVGTATERTQQEQLDDVTQLTVRAHHVRLVSNSHNEADECEFTCSYDDAGLDPRFLSSMEVYLYLGDGDSRGLFTPSADNLRFVGIATSVRRTFSEANGKQLRLRFDMVLRPRCGRSRLDRPAAQDQRQNDSTDRLFFAPDAAKARDTALGSAVSERIAKVGLLGERPCLPMRGPFGRRAAVRSG